MTGKNSEPGGTSGIGDRPQDDFVTRNLSDPSDRPPRTLTLSGLLGDSDRTGFRRLYFNKQLDYYAEFASADVLSAEDVGSDQPPFVGLDATKVTLRRDATVHFTQVAQATPVDEFDLDLRLGQPRPTGMVPRGPETFPGPTLRGCRTEFVCATDFGCPTEFNTGCRPHTCQCTADTACVTFDSTCRCTADAACATAACATVGPETRQFTANAECATQTTCLTCGEATCATCAGATCRTCDGATCATCAGATCRTCDQATCDTCHGTTCRTCDTCNPHVFTCGPNPQCRV
ncbi:hypothetical protein ACFV0O_08655 [Kitasatospora sp. NPDC059577]|uniref:hypothetical protein n=1 Tax=Kitasatospora sp. NPDC059577 TaxID=3346873 RepID=UPI0036A930C7